MNIDKFDPWLTLLALFAVGVLFGMSIGYSLAKGL